LPCAPCGGKAASLGFSKGAAFAASACFEREASRMVHGALPMLIDTVINIYFWMLVAHAVLSWLIAFNIVNTSNQFVYQVGGFLYRVIEPTLRPIRRVIPTINGVDLSFLVLIIGIQFLRNVLSIYVYPYLP
jgi:YggT family protein